MLEKEGELEILRILSVILALLIFGFSTFVSFYEGSEILYRTTEWEHSTLFSGTVKEAEDIMVIDYLVYASKFSLYPLIMLVSAAWIVYQLAYWLFRQNNKVHLIFHFVSVGFSVGIVLLIHDSPTRGLEMFTLFFYFLIVYSIIMIIRLLRRKFSYNKINSYST